jgi:anhydro-N-acetylmuramic acid kinase
MTMQVSMYKEACTNSAGGVFSRNGHRSDIRHTRGGRQRGLDLVATPSAFTAVAIAADHARRLAPVAPVDEVILGGGGAHNPVLVEHLRARLAPARLRMPEEFGLPADAKEAMAFALLGHATLQGRPANVPAATGARHPVVLGKIVPAGASR